MKECVKRLRNTLKTTFLNVKLQRLCKSHHLQCITSSNDWEKLEKYLYIMDKTFVNVITSFGWDFKPRSWLSVVIKNPLMASLSSPYTDWLDHSVPSPSEKLVCGGRFGALWLPSHHTGRFCRLVVLLGKAEKRYINVIHYYYYYCCWMPVVSGPSDDTVSLIGMILSLTLLNRPRNTSRNHCRVNTICRAICRFQLKLYHTKRKTYMNMAQKRRRVLWAKAYLKMTVSKWKSVL